MKEKGIKRLIVKELKREFPNWRRLTRKEKKWLVREVVDEVMSKDLDAEVRCMTMNELLGLPDVPPDVIPLNEMKQFIEDINRGVLLFPNNKFQKKIKDTELKEIDALLDDKIINRILAPSSYTPSMCTIFPSQFFRAELLKCIRYPEISYRKYCNHILNNLESKTPRSFVHLPLHKKTMIDHTQLSKFRTNLTISQIINMMIYVMHLFIENGNIEYPFKICGVDSTDIASISNSAPLATIEVGKKKVRIYSELDADCGKRRKKRDKSEYFVGYRIHTLVAIDPGTGNNYPLFSLVAPANHHDKLPLAQILSFSKAMGLELDIITADEAYADAEQNEEFNNDFDVKVITPPKKNVLTPDNVESESKCVYMNDFCEIPMDYMGRTGTNHEFKCGDESQECLHSNSCPKFREIPIDAGLFGQIPDQVEGVEDVRDIRKNMERTYNLLKHREGLEPLRVRSQHCVLVATTFGHMSTLLLEIVGTRKTKKKEVPSQQKLPFAV